MFLSSQPLRLATSLLLTGLLAVGLLTACKKSDDSPKPSDDNSSSSCSSLPSSVNSWLNSNYPNQTVFKCERKTDGRYNVYTDGAGGCIEFYFTSQGAFLERESCLRSGDDDSVVSYSDLPESVRQWLTTNHPNARILEGKRKDGGWKIKIQDGSGCYECSFGASGQLTKKESC